MCGIAGFAAAGRLGPDERHRARMMRDVLVHRGPDGAGLWADEHAALAHRRLSIVDLAGGHQPLANEAGAIWVTFNGEIYNHAGVRAELEAAGHQYKTRSDTETIVHAYEQYGDDFVARLDGMFAFALWDGPGRRLVLARDRSGKKPLFHAFDGRTFTFASEIKAVLACSWMVPKVAEERLAEYLTFGCVHSPSTLYRGIQSLPPGTFLVVEDGRVAWVGDEGAAPATDDPEANFRRLETVRLIQVALDQLPTHYGNALEWKYVYGFSVDEIAAKLGVGIEAAQSLLARAKRGFQEVYGALTSELAGDAPRNGRDEATETS